MISKSLIKKFIKEALKKFNGEYVIIGGSVLHLLDISDRVTMDIDCIGLNVDQMGDTLKMMEIAEKLSLPVEAINQAGAYFLQKIEGFQQHLLVVEKNDHCTIYRPDLYLFIQLKLGRLTDSDFQDILKYVEHEKKVELKESIAQIIKIIKGKIKSEPSVEKKMMLEKIVDVLS